MGRQEMADIIVFPHEVDKTGVVKARRQDEDEYESADGCERKEMATCQQRSLGCARE